MTANAPTWRIEPRAAARTLEFACFQWPCGDLSRQGLPMAAGAVHRDAQERALLLHYAPGRWLAPEASSEQQSLLEAAAAAGAGVLLDVTGKWADFEVSGPEATRLLGFTIDIGAVLARRDCAAVTLMDCPAVVARAGAGFRVWVQASYATHFLDTAAQCAAALR
jgi:heterotetrameric sarcosine oxidase gamma subunit